MSGGKTLPKIILSLSYLLMMKRYWKYAPSEERSRVMRALTKGNRFLLRQPQAFFPKVLIADKEVACGISYVFSTKMPGYRAHVYHKCKGQVRFLQRGSAASLHGDTFLGSPVSRVKISRAIHLNSKITGKEGRHALHIIHRLSTL